MAKQRGHGEGSVYQRKDGRWVASITLENRKRKYIYGETKKEVLDKLKVALYEQQQGTLATGRQQTLKTYLHQWLEEVHKPTIRLGSYNNYRIVLDKHIIPALGHIQVQKLTPQQVQAFYTAKLKEGLAPSTIKRFHGVLHRALKHAVRWNIVPQNVCDMVSLPRKVRREMKSLTREQARKLIASARQHNLEGLITLAVVTGMRKGELLGLKWQDIDFDTKSLYIRRTTSRIGKYGIIESEPKTLKSQRKIVLPSFIIDTLKKHRDRQVEIQAKLGAGWRNKGLVFCNGVGGFLDSSQLHEAYKSLLKDAGLPPIRFHDLRHSAATILFSMGVHPKVVQELLGHSNITMTLDTYSHVLPSMLQDAMDGWDKSFEEES